MAVETRAFVRERLEQRRIDLSQAVQDLGEGAAALRVTPEWSALDALRHVLAWQDLALAALDRWLDERETLAPDHDPDPVNAGLLAERAGLDLATTVDRIHDGYERFEQMLGAADAELAEVAAAPWGDRCTRLQAISGILWHDGEHLAEIRAARARG